MSVVETTGLTSTLLNSDAAALATENSNDTASLQRLAQFGTNLAKYCTDKMNERKQFQQNAVINNIHLDRGDPDARAIEPTDDCTAKAVVGEAATDHCRADPAGETTNDGTLALTMTAASAVIPLPPQLARNNDHLYHCSPIKQEDSEDDASQTKMPPARRDDCNPNYPFQSSPTTGTMHDAEDSHENQNLPDPVSSFANEASNQPQLVSRDGRNPCETSLAYRDMGKRGAVTPPQKVPSNQFLSQEDGESRNKMSSRPVVECAGHVSSSIPVNRTTVTPPAASGRSDHGIHENCPEAIMSSAAAVIGESPEQQQLDDVIPVAAHHHDGAGVITACDQLAAAVSVGDDQMVNKHQNQPDAVTSPTVVPVVVNGLEQHKLNDAAPVAEVPVAAHHHGGVVTAFDQQAVAAVVGADHVVHENPNQSNAVIVNSQEPQQLDDEAPVAAVHVAFHPHHGVGAEAACYQQETAAFTSNSVPPLLTATTAQPNLYGTTVGTEQYRGDALASYHTGQFDGGSIAAAAVNTDSSSDLRGGSKRALDHQSLTDYQERKRPNNSSLAGNDESLIMAAAEAARELVDEAFGSLHNPTLEETLDVGATCTTTAHEVAEPSPPAIATSLDQSSLRRSTGQTRKVLNGRLDILGLASKFGQGVVSKNGIKVSHLTFHSRWNDLPLDDKGRLQWWVGEGPNRVTLAAPLDPSRHPQCGVPIFWALQRAKGGSLCHYVGHWVCVRFDVFPPTRLVMFKTHQRQALLEFEFVKFDQVFAQNME